MPRTLLLAVVLLAVGCGGDPINVTAASTSTTTSTTAVPLPLPRPQEIAETRPVGLPAVVASGPATGDAVALTFDADLTPGMQQRLRSGQVASYANMAVIDILRRTDTPATIFFTGLWMEDYPQQAADIAADPRFELATHSQTHRAFRGDCYGLAVVPPAEMADEVRRPVEALDRIAPRASRYFRFPGLCHDPAALAAIASVGVTVVDGDSSGDAGGTSVDAIVHQTVDRAHPGSIVVMHLNGGDKAGLTDDALPRIIDGLRAKGLRPTTLSDLLDG